MFVVELSDVWIVARFKKLVALSLLLLFEFVLACCSIRFVKLGGYRSII
jgi:NADH:ubiquinone oxidoreductase subunit B-like Fe-S oxidoreductase